MTDRDLGEGLLRREGDPGEAAGRAREAARTAIRRWRNAVRALAAATILLWGLVAAGALAAALGFVIWFLPKFAQLAADGGADREAVNRMIRLTAVYLQGAALVWAALVVVAAAGTVAFVLASRTATLRQIGASLAELTEELRRLPRGSQERPGEGPLG